MENVKDILRNYILEHFEIEADDPDFADDVHLFDYGFSRFEMGYASAIATVLFVVMILCNKAIQSILRKVGT